ncbi:MAG: hypothetical protein OJF58_000156 [Enhydrobacter sp.]|nr:MAG: hypothetical protein OJF58_000156 [Enhydrobacter sp.]
MLLARLCHPERSEGSLADADQASLAMLGMTRHWASALVVSGTLLRTLIRHHLILRSARRTGDGDGARAHPSRRIAARCSSG